MPETTPKIKVNAVKALNATVVLNGDSYDDAYEHAKKLEASTGAIFIHPYDDVDVIAGQGTIGLEIIEQLSEPIDMVFVAVGGGGLLAGILGAFKTLSPTTKIIAVEPVNSNCLAAAMAANERVILNTVGIFTDGVAVKQIGQLPFDIIKKYVDDTICVSIDDICSAIKDIYEETRTVVEPAGALSLAGMKHYLHKISQSNLNIVTINCGANMNFDRLRHIAERTEHSENNESLLAVTIPENPGSLKQFCELLDRRTITEFNYRYQSNDQAIIFVGVSHDDLPIQNFLDQLSANNYIFTDLTTNECAKIHIRHMVGGRPQSTRLNEQLFRFQFPERPGALLDFLDALQNHWNITLFHYRNHGAAFGRVLVGLDINTKDESKLHQFINNLGFNYFNETNNIAYELFCK